MCTILSTLLCVLSLAPVLAVADESPRHATTAIVSQRSVSRGRRIYQDGVVASGEPLRATVAGDIAVDGRMFTCASCHLRSGLGATEGVVIAPPINGAHLFRPLARGAPWRGSNFPRADVRAWESPPPWFDPGYLRPAYGDETLARAIREGVAPDGRVLASAMPRFELEDEEMSALLAYLKQLSAERSPGVTDGTIRFATVIAGDVPARDRAAMLAVLDAYVAAKNAQPRQQKKRARAGAFYRREAEIAYRQLELLRWELIGPPATWQEQLERHYRDKPVFAMLGGIAAGHWAPIHEFCESHGLPALFPITETPVVASDDWYTLYFSKGVVQEAEAAARYLRRTLDDDSRGRLVQIYRIDSGGAVLARGFAAAWSRLGREAPDELVLATDQQLTGSTLSGLSASGDGGVLLLWLGAEDVSGLASLAENPDTTPKVILASGLLGSDLSVVPDALRRSAVITYPYSLPAAEKLGLLPLQRWLQLRNIPSRNTRIEAKMYFLARMLSGLLGELRNDFYRDYLLDVMDMMLDQDYLIASYPRLSFGPSQRYASKGCYIVRLTAGPDPEVVPVTGWVVQ